MNNSNYNKSVRIILTATELYRKPAYDIDNVIERIKLYDRDAVLIVLSKWQLMLRQRHSKDPYWQFHFIKHFLSRSQYKRLRNNLQNKPRLAVTEDAVLSLMKINLEHNTPGGNEISQNKDSKGLFKLLISINSHYVKEVLPEIKKNRQEYRDEIIEELRYSMAKQALGINASEILHEIYRGKRIINHLNAVHPIFKQKFLEGAGIELEEYYEILFLLLLDWGYLIGNKTPDKTVFKNIEQYFSKSSIDLRKVQKVLALHSFEADEFQNLHRQYTQEGNLQDIDDQWNFILFFNRQMVHLEKGLLCLSPDALTMQLSEGPYNIVRRQLKADNATRSLSELPNWWGEAYEDYIIERLQNTFKDKLTATNVTLRTGGQSIDAVVELDDMVLLVEIKYPHWKFATRVNPTKDDVLSHISKFVDRNKGLGQINKFLEHNANGNLTQEFNFDDKFILPVLILGEEFPFDPFNRQLITDYAKENNLLPDGERILPYIILTSNEVEIMEGFAEQYSVRQVKNFLGMYSGGFLDSSEKPDLEKPTTFLNIFVMNNVVVQNSEALKRNLDELYESLIVKFRPAVEEYQVNEQGDI